MRINFENLLFNETINIKNKVFYVSGNEETLINKVEKTLVSKFNNIGISNIEKIKFLEDQQNNQNLFFDKSLTIMYGTKGVKKDILDNFLNENKPLIIVAENTRGDASLKKLFEKKEGYSIIYCYKLSKIQKTNIFKQFIDRNKVKITKDAFEYVIENTEDRYIFFENEIEKIINLNKKLYNVDDIKKIIKGYFNEDFYILFFSILKTNSKLVSLYNSTINNISDLYKFLQITKFCFEIISKSKNLSELDTNIPRYMFKEKNNFITIFKKLNTKNKNNIYRLIFKTESLIRKNNSQYFSIGNRFL